MASSTPSAAPPSVVYLVQRHDYSGHEYGETAQIHLHSIHTSKAAATKKAKVFVRTIRRDEDTNGLADLEEEKEDKHDYYYAWLRLSHDVNDGGVDHTEVTVSKMHLRDENESPYSDAEDEDDFASEIGDADHHPLEETAEDSIRPEGLGQPRMEEELENAKKRRKV
jgi:hypothetical protein